MIYFLRLLWHYFSDFYRVWVNALLVILEQRRERTLGCFPFSNLSQQFFDFLIANTSFPWIERCNLFSKDTSQIVILWQDPKAQVLQVQTIKHVLWLIEMVEKTVLDFELAGWALRFYFLI
jgi:hypothetical protein